jgi:hypothetical protein
LTAQPTGNQINLTWNAPGDTDVIGYRIDRSIESGGEVTFSDTTPELSYSDINFDEQGLDPEITYCYTVRAFDAAQNSSSPSNEVCINFPESADQEAEPPTISTVSSADNFETGEIEINW